MLSNVITYNENNTNINNNNNNNNHENSNDIPWSRPPDADLGGRQAITASLGGGGGAELFSAPGAEMPRRSGRVRAVPGAGAECPLRKSQLP